MRSLIFVCEAHLVCPTEEVLQNGLGALAPGAGPNPPVCSRKASMAGAPPVGSGGDAEPAWKMACGACAGILAQTITYPGDTIRRRMQTNGMGGAPRLYRHSWDCCVQTVRNEGVRGLFHGLKANVVRSIPGAAIQFAAYDTLKEVLDCA